MHGGSLVGETKWSVEKMPMKARGKPFLPLFHSRPVSMNPPFFHPSTPTYPLIRPSAHPATHSALICPSSQWTVPNAYYVPPPAPSAANKTMQHLLRCSAWCLEAEGPLRITLVASASVGCGREWRRHVWCALQSPEQGGGGGKELRATLARWLHSSPWRKWGLHAVRRYTRTVFPVGWQGHLESKDYSLLMCEEKKSLIFFLPFSDIVKG